MSLKATSIVEFVRTKEKLDVDQSELRDYYVQTFNHGLENFMKINDEFKSYVQ